MFSVINVIVWTSDQLFEKYKKWILDAVNIKEEDLDQKLHLQISQSKQ